MSMQNCLKSFSSGAASRMPAGLRVG
jgi:hypothetical protein